MFHRFVHKCDWFLGGSRVRPTALFGGYSIIIATTASIGWSAVRSDVQNEISVRNIGML